MATVGNAVTGDIQTGEALDFDILIARAGKYVVELSGPATVQLGLYQGMISGATGKLRVCGSGAWGCRSLDAAPHLVQCKGIAGGTFTFLVRPWSFFDYFKIGSHKSTC